jgi:hypothetical protein
MKPVKHLLLVFTVVGILLPWDGVGEVLETENFRISVESGAASVIQVSPRDSSNANTFSVRREGSYGSLTKVFEAPKKIGVVFSMISERDNEIVVINLSDASVYATVRCLTYEVSPKGDNIVFERYEPRFTPADQLRPATMIFDISGNEAQTVLLYPRTEADTRTPDGKVNVPVSPFLWTSDGSKLVYFNKVSDYGSWDDFRLELIVATLRDRWSVVVHELDKQPFVRDSASADRLRFFISQMEWVEPGVFNAVWHPSFRSPLLQSTSFHMTTAGMILQSEARSPDTAAICP